MLKNENIICISTIDWDFIWQGHQEIMSTLAKGGNRVLFIENTGVRAPGIKDIPRLIHRAKNWFRGVAGIREEMHNLFVFSPMVLPFPYLKLAQWINRQLILLILKKWMAAASFNSPIIWTFLPTPLSLGIIASLSKKLVVYYCIDNYRVSSANKVARSEMKLLKDADLIFATSHKLYNYCANYNNKVHLFPFVVSYELFAEARIKSDVIPDELEGIRRPLIGYVGGVHKWIDQRLVRELAEKYNNLSFVFVGTIQTDISLLSGLKNVYFLGQKEHKRLPIFIKNFEVCTIPYSVTDYTKNVYPTKLNEYLAMGKAVVSTELPEIIAFNIKYKDMIYIAEAQAPAGDSRSFGACINRAFVEDNQDLRKRRIEAAKENSWSNTIENMSNLIKAELEKKKLDIGAQWKEKLVGFYRSLRRKAAVLGVICALMYIILFRTPLIWFLAEPLKITELPKGADVIVVFAGGVGESGRAGQGYEERVKYSVELYNQGYADEIIFSSGTVSTFAEAYVMQVLAVSLGIPADRITLEDNAVNTYENVKFVNQLLKEKGWRQILLVSSPYHMRRASLVFNKVARDIQVTQTPVPDSQYYAHASSSGASLRQIRSIVHEYLGIVYYWWKGYI